MGLFAVLIFSLFRGLAVRLVLDRFEARTLLPAGGEPSMEVRSMIYNNMILIILSYTLILLFSVGGEGRGDDSQAVERGLPKFSLAR